MFLRWCWRDLIFQRGAPGIHDPLLHKIWRVNTISCYILFVHAGSLLLPFTRLSSLLRSSISLRFRLLPALISISLTPTYTSPHFCSLHLLLFAALYFRRHGSLVVRSRRRGRYRGIYEVSFALIQTSQNYAPHGDTHFYLNYLRHVQPVQNTFPDFVSSPRTAFDISTTSVIDFLSLSLGRSEKADWERETELTGGSTDRDKVFHGQSYNPQPLSCLRRNNPVDFLSSSLACLAGGWLVAMQRWLGLAGLIVVLQERGWR